MPKQKESHPWRNKVRAADNKKKLLLKKTEEWLCPTCLESYCKFGECVTSDY